MPNEPPWEPLTPDLETVLSQSSQPLQALADLETPAVVLRGAYDPDQCPGLIERFINMGLMRDPISPAGLDRTDQRVRIDIGSSLGNRGDDKEAFFSHSAETHRLFRFLFEDFENPVSVIYDALTRLASGKRVLTAQEPDGRQYGPAIFRIHYEGQFYRPHSDRVLLQERRTAYAVHRFKHQFAGVLCIQNAVGKERAAQGIMHRCEWRPDIQEQIDAGLFHEYADEEGIQNCRVDLEPGDLYLFNAGCIHEVPHIVGDQPRIVLAVFLGYSKDDDHT